MLLRLAPLRQQGRGEAASAGLAPQQQHGARGGGGGGGPGGVVGAGAGQRVAGVPRGLGEGGAGEERALAAARHQPRLGVAVPGLAEVGEAAPVRAVTTQNLARQVGLAWQAAGHQDGWGSSITFYLTEVKNAIKPVASDGSVVATVDSIVVATVVVVTWDPKCYVYYFLCHSFGSLRFITITFETS